MELIIKRNKWVNGSNGSDILKPLTKFGYINLLNDQGKMCCLGFLARVCGLKPKDIKAIPGPEGLSDKAIKKIQGTPFSKLFTKAGIQSPICNSLINANDNDKFKPETREKRIKERMKKIGVKVTFVDK